MKVEDLRRRRASICDNISRGRLVEALTRLRSLSEGLMTYEISDAIDRVSSTYRYMLTYALQGAADPQRPRMYADIVEQLYSILDVLTDRAMTADTPTLYYNVKRYEQRQPANTLAALAATYRKSLGDASLFALAGGETPDTRANTRKLEELEKSLFNRLWVTMPMADDDVAIVSSLLNDTVIAAHIKRLILSALLMGLTEYYDERRLLLLLDTYAATDDIDIAMTALAAALIAMSAHRSRVDRSTAIGNRIAALRESSRWSADVSMMFIEFIRTRDIESINKTFREDIIPKINEIGGDLKRSFKNIDPENIDPEADFNPEWAELLDKSGISDKLRKLSEMQEQGSDVMMSAFATMKSYPFFNDISNWFMPWHQGHSLYMDLDASLHDTLSMFAESMNLCDSDCYSLLLSLNAVPGKQLDMLRQASNMAGDAQEMMEQLRNSRQHTEADNRRIAANRYVRDLYRFFKLFRRKGEFNDPFATRLNLMTVSVLSEDFSDIDTMRVVAEFYFKHGQWEDALAVMRRLEDTAESSAELYQKMGYCLQQNGDNNGALEYYCRAELLNADSVWLIKRLARCYRAIGDHARAGEYYARLDTMQPDDFTTTMALGTLCVEAGDYSRALELLHKAEFLNEKSHKPWRPIAWAALMSGDTAKASLYYSRIAGDNPDSTDMLNMGHLRLVMGDPAGAVEHYRTSSKTDGKGLDRLIKLIEADSPELRRLGVADDLLTLIPDILTSSDFK